jgi:hypothetical protein
MNVGRVGGHTRLEHGLADAPVALGICAHQVDAGEAVHLKVDEAGCREPAPVGGAQAVAGDDVVDDLDVAGDDLRADERGFDA